jgi:hypothetical protein
MRWSVVESLPVVETIKYGGPDRDEQIEVYKESLRNLSAECIHCICYNFMPVLDWARTDLFHDNPNGATNLYFNYAEFAYFDIYILKREGAREEWANFVMKNEKGEVIPAELVEKINNSLKFNQGFMTTELCAASILDMKWHELESIEGIDIDAFEKQVCQQMGLIPEIGPRYRTTYFNHIFSSGYSAGYYGYLWAEVLDKDAFSVFEASGNVWNKELANKFKQTFLERGGSEEPMVLYEQFTGRQPDNTAFLKGRGLK